MTSSDAIEVNHAKNLGSEPDVIKSKRHHEKRHSKSGKKKSSSKKSSSKKSSGRHKDMLMDLIAKEMVSTFDQQQGSSGPLTEEAPGLTAAEIFYAQMNGEAITSQSSMPEDVEEKRNEDDYDNDEDEDGFDDACSFAYLGETIGGMVEETPSEEFSRGRRSSTGGSSHGSASGISKSTNSASSTSNSTVVSDDETMSVEDIQKFVMENMPPEVRDRIPKEAWAQIFGQKKRARRAKKPIKVDIEKEDDVSSVVSDITTSTKVQRVPEDVVDFEDELAPTLPPGCDHWDEEICPGLSDGDTRTRRSSIMSSACSTISGKSAVSYREDATGSIIASKEGGVKFGNVQVRYYQQILDINPAVTSGAALGIGWKFKRGGTISVDDWELQRGQLRKSTDLVLPRHTRENILRDLGYSQKDIADATRIIRKAKERRKVTVANLNVQTYEEAVESAARKVKGLLSFGRKKGLV